MTRPAREAKRALLIATALLAALAVGCGGGDSEPESDEAQVEAAIETWLLEGDCGVMTDKFLQAQTFESDPDLACERFEDAYAEPLYSEEDIEITDVQVNGDEASAVVGGEGSDVTSTYELVNEDGTWKIDAASLN